MNFPPITPFAFDPQASGITVFHPAAKPLFERARSRANFHAFVASLVGKPRQLRCLQEEEEEMSWRDQEPHQYPVLVQQIRGSADRVREFDCDFYPTRDASESRWVRIASMMLHGTTLPPVELVQVGSIYFVIDGHHRVSVSLMMGQKYIDAVVRSAWHPS